jgi:hypothetical protein
MRFNMPTKKQLVVIALLMLPFVATCQAGVIYIFTGTTAAALGPPFIPLRTEEFRYTSPNFILSKTDVFATQLDSCVNCWIGPPSFLAVEFQPFSSPTTV